MNSRKIIPIFVACIVSVGLISFAVTKDRWIFAAKNGQSSDIQLVVEKALQDSAEKDANGNGIKDWEEDFEKNSAGTDGSNTSAATINSTTANTDAAPKTLTDALSRNLFAEYMRLKQSGNLNSDSMTTLVNKAVSSIDTSEAKSFSSSDIKTIPDNDLIGAKNYLNALVAIKEKYKALYSSNQIITVGGRINFDDPASIQSIESTSDLYKSITEELKKLLVPKSLVAAHVELLNEYTTSYEGLAALANIKTDPIAAVGGIQRHTKSTEREPEILASISQFFTNKGIAFSQDEAGSRINNL